MSSAQSPPPLAPPQASKKKKKKKKKKKMMMMKKNAPNQSASQGENTFKAPTEAGKQVEAKRVETTGVIDLLQAAAVQIGSESKNHSNTPKASRRSRLQRLKRIRVRESGGKTKSIAVASRSGSSLYDTASVDVDTNELGIELSILPEHSTDAEQGNKASTGPKRAVDHKQSHGPKSSSTEVVNPLVPEILDSLKIKSVDDLDAYLNSGISESEMQTTCCTIRVMAIVLFGLAVTATYMWAVISSAEYPGSWMLNAETGCCEWRSRGAITLPSVDVKLRHTAALDNIFHAQFVQIVFGACLAASCLWVRQRFLFHFRQRTRHSRNKSPSKFNDNSWKLARQAIIWLPFAGLAWACLDVSPGCLHELRESGGQKDWSTLHSAKISFNGQGCGSNKSNTSAVENFAPQSPFAVGEISADDREENCTKDSRSVVIGDEAECQVVRISGMQTCAGWNKKEKTRNQFTPYEWYSNTSRLGMSGSEVGAIIDLGPEVFELILDRFNPSSSASQLLDEKADECMASVLDFTCSAYAPPCLSELAAVPGSDASCTCVQKNSLTNSSPATCTPLASGVTCSKSATDICFDLKFEACAHIFEEHTDYDLTETLRSLLGDNITSDLNLNDAIDLLMNSLLEDDGIFLVKQFYLLFDVLQSRGGKDPLTGDPLLSTSRARPAFFDFIRVVLGLFKLDDSKCKGGDAQSCDSLKECVNFFAKYGSLEASVSGSHDDIRCQADSYLKDRSVQELRSLSIANSQCNISLGQNSEDKYFESSICPRVCSPGTSWAHRISVVSSACVWCSLAGWAVYAVHFAAGALHENSSSHNGVGRRSKTNLHSETLTLESKFMFRAQESIRTFCGKGRSNAGLKLDKGNSSSSSVRTPLPIGLYVRLFFPSAIMFSTLVLLLIKYHGLVNTDPREWVSHRSFAFFGTQPFALSMVCLTFVVYRIVTQLAISVVAILSGGQEGVRRVLNSGIAPGLPIMNQSNACSCRHGPLKWYASTLGFRKGKFFYWRVLFSEILEWLVQLSTLQSLMISTNVSYIYSVLVLLMLNTVLTPLAFFTRGSGYFMREVIIFIDTFGDVIFLGINFIYFDTVAKMRAEAIFLNFIPVPAVFVGIIWPSFLVWTRSRGLSIAFLRNFTDPKNSVVNSLIVKAKVRKFSIKIKQTSFISEMDSEAASEYTNAAETAAEELYLREQKSTLSSTIFGMLTYTLKQTKADTASETTPVTMLYFFRTHACKIFELIFGTTVATIVFVWLLESIMIAVETDRFCARELGDLGVLWEYADPRVIASPLGPLDTSDFPYLLDSRAQCRWDLVMSINARNRLPTATSYIPEHVASKFVSLNSLDLRDNSLTKFPSVLLSSKFRQLSRVQIHGNPIFDHLDLSGIPLLQDGLFPPRLCNLTGSLRSLANKITGEDSKDEWSGNGWDMHHIKVLDLRNSSLRKLPTNLAACLPCLQELRIGDNPSLLNPMAPSVLEVWFAMNLSAANRQRTKKNKCNQVNSKDISGSLSKCISWSKFIQVEKNVNNPVGVDFDPKISHDLSQQQCGCEDSQSDEAWKPFLLNLNGSLVHTISVDWSNLKIGMRERCSEGYVWAFLTDVLAQYPTHSDKSKEKIANGLESPMVDALNFECSGLPSWNLKALYTMSSAGHNFETLMFDHNDYAGEDFQLTKPLKFAGEDEFAVYRYQGTDTIGAASLDGLDSISPLWRLLAWISRTPRNNRFGGLQRFSMGKGSIMSDTFTLLDAMYIHYHVLGLNTNAASVLISRSSSKSTVENTNLKGNSSVSTIKNFSLQGSIIKSIDWSLSKHPEYAKCIKDSDSNACCMANPIMSNPAPYGPRPTMLENTKSYCEIEYRTFCQKNDTNVCNAPRQTYTIEKPCPILSYDEVKDWSWLSDTKCPNRTCNLAPTCCYWEKGLALNEYELASGMTPSHNYKCEDKCPKGYRLCPFRESMGAEYCVPEDVESEVKCTDQPRKRKASCWGKFIHATFCENRGPEEFRAPLSLLRQLGSAALESVHIKDMQYSNSVSGTEVLQELLCPSKVFQSLILLSTFGGETRLPDCLFEKDTLISVKLISPFRRRGKPKYGHLYVDSVMKKYKIAFQMPHSFENLGGLTNMKNLYDFSIHHGIEPNIFGNSLYHVCRFYEWNSSSMCYTAMDPVYKKLPWSSWSHTNLTGTIPNIPASSNVIQIDLNHLEGPIPSQWCEQDSQLRVISLILMPNLLGPLPYCLGGSNQTRLARLFIGGNPNLTGSIPWENLSERFHVKHDARTLPLRELILPSNNLSGLAFPPKEFGFRKGLTGSVCGLRTYMISDNPHLSGNISSDITNCRELEGLYLHGTNLSGAIPAELCGMCQIRVITLHNIPFFAGDENRDLREEFRKKCSEMKTKAYIMCRDRYIQGISKNSSCRYSDKWCRRIVHDKTTGMDKGPSGVVRITDADGTWNCGGNQSHDRTREPTCKETPTNHFDGDGFCSQAFYNKKLHYMQCNHDDPESIFNSSGPRERVHQYLLSNNQSLEDSIYFDVLYSSTVDFI